MIRTHAARALRAAAVAAIRLADRLHTPPAPILAKAHAHAQLDDLAARTASRARHPSADRSEPSAPPLRVIGGTLARRWTEDGQE